MFPFTIIESLFNMSQRVKTPDNFPDSMLSVFQAFKRAFDSRNISDLNAMISENYTGDLYGAQEKAQLMIVFNDMFQSVTNLVSLNLQITVYQITSCNDEEFRAIVDLYSSATLIGGLVPLPFTQASGGTIDIELRQEGKHKMWKIYSMYEVKK